MDREDLEVTGLGRGRVDHGLADVAALHRLGEGVVGDQERRLERLERGHAGGVPDRARDGRHRHRAAADVGQQLTFGLRVGRLRVDGQLAGRVDLVGVALGRDSVRVLRGGHIRQVQGRGAAGRAPPAVSAELSSSSPQATSPSASAPAATTAARRQAHERRVTSSPPCRSRQTCPSSPHSRPGTARIGATLPQRARRLSTSARSPFWYAKHRFASGIWAPLPHPSQEPRRR